jgi:AcrR family transcriptional regulator
MEMEKEKKVDRRIRKTKSQLHKGLLSLLQRKNIKDITIKELVDEVDINRSTFYLHYTDIYQIMDEIETDLLDKLRAVIESHPSNEIKDTLSFIEDLFVAFDTHREVGRILMGPNVEWSFVHKAETLVEDGIKERLSIVLGDDYEVSPYVYSFCRSGILGLLKTWMRETSPSSPKEMAEITYGLMLSIIRQFHPELQI